MVTAASFEPVDPHSALKERDELLSEEHAHSTAIRWRECALGDVTACKGMIASAGDLLSEALSRPDSSTPSEYDGMRAAQRFNRCMGPKLQTVAWHSTSKVWPSHAVDVMVSRRHRLIYIDNPKAGSSTMHAKLSRALNVTRCRVNSHWNATCTGAAYCEDRMCQVLSHDATSCPGGKHISTRCLDATALWAERWIVFSFVRAPLEKFISGVGELINQTHRLSSAQVLLLQHLALNRKSPAWHANEHLESNSWRLSVSPARLELPHRSGD